MTPVRVTACALLLAVLGLSALPAAAAAKKNATPQPQAPAATEIDPVRQYRICLVLAKTKPEEGWEEALAWTSMGGGEAARHCGAVALIGMGKYEEAASRLEDLAKQSHSSEAIRVEMLAQAGQAWLMAGKTDRADAAQRAGLALVPGWPDLVLDHAVTLAQVHHYKEAVAELSDLLKRQPNRIEALTLRASAYRFLDDLPRARADLDRALELDPGFADALVERGIVRRLNGDVDGARQDWMLVVRTNSEGPALDAARRNLELLDIKPK